MRFGVFMSQRMEATSRSGDEIVEVAQRMDELGYYAGVLGERHQSDAVAAETLTTVTWLLAKTVRLHMASGGFILPIHHPFRLAEQAANLDVLSNGRFVCGIVLGYFGGDFGPFGIRVQERAGRLSEGVEIMRKLWTGERVTHRGRYYALDDALIRPRPRTPGGPPIWIAAKVDAAIQRAAQLGDGWFLSADDTLESVERKIGVYRAAAKAAGKPAGEIVLMRDGFIADSAAEARRIAEQPMLGLFAEYHAWKKDSPDKDRYDSSFEGAIPKLIFGSPDEAVKQVQRYRDLGVDTLVFRCQYEGIAHRDSLRSIELFGRHVIPAHGKD